MSGNGPRDVAIPTTGGLTLRAWLWPHDSPRGTLVVAHGLGEHGGNYRHVAEALGPALGLDVLAFDFRGHGRSPGPRGVVGRYNDLTDDLRMVLDWVGRSAPRRPRFVLGHSNGGQVALRAVLEGESLRGLILSNPAVRLGVRIAPWRLLAGRALRRLSPSTTLRATVTDSQMTRDPEHLAARRLDPLRHARVNAALFFGMIEGERLLTSRAAEVRVPVLMLLGEADPIIDPAASRALFEALGGADKTLIAYPDALHEPLNDLVRPQVLADVAAWIAPRLEEVL